MAGGKSRKSGGVSKALINKLKKGKNCGCNNTSNKRTGPTLFERGEEGKTKAELLDE